MRARFVGDEEWVGYECASAYAVAAAHAEVDGQDCVVEVNTGKEILTYSVTRVVRVSYQTKLIGRRGGR